MKNVDEVIEFHYTAIISFIVIVDICNYYNNKITEWQFAQICVSLKFKLKQLFIKTL